jgi:asparagine synthase (glutamine-hydrolysing)
MCGLTGVFGSKQRIDRAILDGMAGSIRHRGPDDHGSWLDVEAGIGLAHRRLSILDLSYAGHQPMLSASGGLVIVFNGEIYNHLDMRKELEEGNLAPAWRGHSDTETLLAGFDAWGIEATLKRAAGMFALAVWDRNDRTLSLARDRMGEKPLYYGWNGGVFLFCSELKSLLACPSFQAEVDRNVVALFLRYAYVPAPYSIYRGIYKLWPGSILELGLKASLTSPWSGEPFIPPFSMPDIHLTRYWSMLDTAESGVRMPLSGSETEQTEALERLLRKAVAGQMISDVPLGAFLSGGVDSSTIVALMQAECGQRVKTFSIGFHEAGYNEANYARRIARHLGTDHTELYVTPSEAVAVIPKMPEIYDEPFADSSQVPTYLVAELARTNVAVALSGDAGDELFGGYNRYFWAGSISRKTGWINKQIRHSLVRGMVAACPESLDRLFAGIAPLLPSALRLPQLRDKVLKLADLLLEDTPDAIYLALTSHWKHPSEVLSDGAGEPLNYISDCRQWPNLSNFEQRMMYLDAVSYLPDDILVKIDRAAMRVSLETRIPFLDHRVVELAWRLPLSSKIRNGQGKWILRQVLYKYVPREFIERPKTGFGVPIAAWLRGPLRGWADELLSEGRLRNDGFFHPDLIRLKWEEHLAGRRNYHYQIWNVLMFQAWLRQHSALNWNC